MVSRNPWKPLGKLRFRAIVVVMMGPVREGLSVQTHRGTTIEKTAFSCPGHECPWYTPLAHGNESHGFQKALENLWEINVPGMLAEHK